MSKTGSYIGGHTLIQTKVPKKLSLKKNKKKSLLGYKELVKQDDGKIVNHFKEVIERNNRRIKKYLKANKNQSLIKKLSNENLKLEKEIIKQETKNKF